MRCWMREQRILCSQVYQEVDIIPIKQVQSIRGKKTGRSLRLCASEESRRVVCEYRHHKGCIAQLQRDAADALERLEATNKTLMRLMRQQAAELNRRDRLLKEQEAAIQTALDVAEERRQEAAYASEFQCALAPHPDGDTNILACARCGSGEYLHNEDGNRNTYCGQCGQKIDWSGEDEQDD